MHWLGKRKTARQGAVNFKVTDETTKNTHQHKINKVFDTGVLSGG